MTHLELPEKVEQSSKKRKRREEKSRKFEEVKERKNRRGRVLLLEWKSSSSNVLDHVRGSAEGTRLWTLFFCFRFLTQRERDSERESEIDAKSQFADGRRKDFNGLGPLPGFA